MAPENKTFEGQVAIVTGAGRSLGRTYAMGIAHRGGAVVVNDVGGVGQPEGAWADRVVAEIRDAGGKAVASHDNVATPEGGEAITKAAVQHFGSVDIVINNAGILQTAMFATMTPKQLQDVVGIHLLGAFYVTQPAWRIMQKNGYGRVIMTSSSSIFGMQGNSNYLAAKGGIFALAQALALEGEANNIRVNSILPFAVSNIRQNSPHVGPDAVRSAAAQEAMTARRTPESVLPLVLYLASRDCAVTGQAFSALAGRYARTFLGLADGWLADDANAVSADDIARKMSVIGDTSKFIVPRAMLDELESTLDRIRKLEKS